MVYQGEWACPGPEVGGVFSRAEHGLLGKSGSVQAGSGRGLSRGKWAWLLRGEHSLLGKWARPRPEVGVVFREVGVVSEGLPGDYWRGWACPRPEVGVVWRGWTVVYQGKVGAFNTGSGRGFLGGEHSLSGELGVSQTGSRRDLSVKWACP